MANPSPQKHFFQGLGSIFELPVRERVLALHRAILDDPEYSGFDTFTLKEGLTLTHAEPSKTIWELNVGPSLCNKSGNLHGGAAATILDNLTSTALVTISKPGYLDGGHVSRTITMTYLRPVPNGSKVTIECDVEAAGRNTANLMGKIYVDGKLAVTCVHDKVVFARITPVAKL